MGWRKILEAEHRLVLEVADAADHECTHTEATGIGAQRPRRRHHRVLPLLR